MDAIPLLVSLHQPVDEYVVLDSDTSYPSAMLKSSRLLSRCLHNLLNHNDVVGGCDPEDLLGISVNQFLAHCIEVQRTIAEMPVIDQDFVIAVQMDQVDLVAAIVQRDTRPNILEFIVSEKYITQTVTVLRDAIRAGSVSFGNDEQRGQIWLHRVFRMWEGLTGRTSHCGSFYQNVGQGRVDGRVPEELIQAGAVLYFEKFSWCGVDNILSMILPFFTSLPLISADRHLL